MIVFYSKEFPSNAVAANLSNSLLFMQWDILLRIMHIGKMLGLNEKLHVPWNISNPFDRSITNAVERKEQE